MDRKFYCLRRVCNSQKKKKTSREILPECGQWETITFRCHCNRLMKSNYSVFKLRCKLPSVLAIQMRFDICWTLEWRERCTHQECKCQSRSMTFRNSCEVGVVNLTNDYYVENTSKQTSDNLIARSIWIWSFLNYVTSWETKRYSFLIKRKLAMWIR